MFGSALSKAGYEDVINNPIMGELFNWGRGGIL